MFCVHLFGANQANLWAIKECLDRIIQHHLLHHTQRSLEGCFFLFGQPVSRTKIDMKSSEAYKGSAYKGPTVYKCGVSSGQYNVQYSTRSINPIQYLNSST